MVVRSPDESMLFDSFYYLVLDTESFDEMFSFMTCHFEVVVDNM